MRPKTELRPFRSHILRSFVGFSTVVIAGAAVLLFATNKVTEDLVLRRQLTAMSAAPNNADSGLFSGPLEVMPERYRQALGALLPGFSELDMDGREIHVLQAGKGNDARFAAIIMAKDSSSTPFLLLLLLASSGALLLAYAVSRNLATRFSAPVERIAAALQPGRTATCEATDGVDGVGPQPVVEEFALLRRQVAAFREEQASRLEREAVFARSVSHELRTPITVVEGAIELLTTADEPALRNARLARIQRAVTNMRMTTETLLALTRAEQHAFVANETFESALQSVVAQQRQLLNKPVSIRAEIGSYPQSPAEWRSLLIALQTLLDNAIRHTQRGEIVVETSDREASVVDTGDGMSRELCEQLSSGQSMAAGLGYPLVRRICNLYSWRLGIESGATGTAVRIRLTTGCSVPAAR